MSKWIAEFELEDGDTMPEHMDLEYKGAKIDFHCKPLEQEPIFDKVKAEIEKQEKWLMSAGYNAYNVGIAFNAIKKFDAMDYIKPQEIEMHPDCKECEWNDPSQAQCYDGHIQRIGCKKLERKQEKESKKQGEKRNEY